MAALRSPVHPGTDTDLVPNEEYVALGGYHAFLKAVRKAKGMRLKDVELASASPDFPNSRAKLPALSRMEKGGAKEPTFRQMCKYARGYGVPLAKLEYFFRNDADAAHRGRRIERDT